MRWISLKKSLIKVSETSVFKPMWSAVKITSVVAASILVLTSCQPSQQLLCLQADIKKLKEESKELDGNLKRIKEAAEYWEKDELSDNTKTEDTK